MECCCFPSPNKPSSFHLLFFFFLFLYMFFTCNGQDRLSKGQSLGDGETIVSSGGAFELGFFSPGNSTLRFVGIWYHNISVNSVVWVANRENPLSDRNGIFTIGSNGSIVIIDGSNNTNVWSSSSSSSSSQSTNSTAVLMDTGNLILYEDANDSSSALWQSYDHPTDTFLPSMEVKVNSVIGENQAFISWKSESDPSPGNFSMGLDSRASIPQIVIWDGSIRRWRSGHWNGLTFIGIPNMTANILYGFRLSTVESNGNIYITYTAVSSSNFIRFQIGWDGLGREFRWDTAKNEWSVWLYEPVNDCEKYNRCGDFGVCDINSNPICSCMDGFVPRYTDEWKKGNWTGGCARRTELQCGKNSTSNTSIEEGGGDGFFHVNDVKLPDFADKVSGASNSGDCRTSCLGNCSCYAFSYVNTIGCMVWGGHLIDIQHFESGGGDLYVRVAASEIAKSKISTIVIVIVVVMGSFFMGLLICLLLRFKEVLREYSIACCRSRKMEIPLFDISRGNTDPSSEISGKYDLAGETKQTARVKLSCGLPFCSGYISPEYAMEGLFSIKSDVYSFGVLILEIVSGRRNTGFRSSEHSNLIGHAWHLWNEGEVMELVDPAIVAFTPRSEVERCIHVGMLCVQDSPAERPSMSSVILHLESEAAALPCPSQPTFTSRREIDPHDYFEADHMNASLNNITVTMMDGR
ncbi:hypothetical protein SAY86_011009 [Trapa natans]|uniref:Receptor-like serine/threonine-protein kinase n=1 Tax=Trapa natans TaxID=22666 RepID=A0AAN7LXP1_TRANT|nr:hypothetical protein SAY86_011009 [Trapa natans]